VMSIERSFNYRHHYPLVIFHEEETDRVEWIRQSIKSVAEFSGEVRFEQVNFRIPIFLNEKEVPEYINAYNRNFSIGYRHMCRFFAGQIFRMDSIKRFDWIWRIDTDSMYICNIPYDPFRVMQENGKKYGFVAEILEGDDEVVEGLWEATVQFAKYHGISLSQFDGYRNYLGGYTRCHWWNNFEIMNVRFFRNSDYSSYYAFIDQLGGIYKHRWGDALIRTLGVLMFAEPDEIYQFTDIGYIHPNACMNPCGWENDPHIQCDELPTGRSETCTVPNRFIAGVPHSTVRTTKSLIMITLFLAVSAIIYFQPIQWHVFALLMGRIGVWKRTRDKQEEDE